MGEENKRRPHTGWADALSGIDARIDDVARADGDGGAPVVFLREGELERALRDFPEPELAASAGAFASGMNFTGAAGEKLILPGADGAPAAALFGCGGGAREAQVGAAPFALPATPGGWRFANGGLELQVEDASREWLLGAYTFERYKAAQRPPAHLAADLYDRVRHDVAGVYFARDLVNTPAGDLGPEALEEAARALADAQGAEIQVTTGDALLGAGFPMIHAVGRAAAQAPRLIDLRWSAPDAAKDAPLVTLVGKGVCFDTGGLDIKPSRAMRNMKKDMGGAAVALGAALILMRRNAQIRLRVLIPAVENAVGPNAFRPGDVLESRGGLTVEIDNTDAEGRLVLADALSLAVEEKPALLIDFATLTGAARVALGGDLPALYTDDDALAADFLEAGEMAMDPLWRLPLYKPYRGDLASKVADLKNASSTGLAGSITAALFLERFAADAPSWAHLDVFAWNVKTRPGRPEGGEGQCARAAARVVLARFGSA